MSSPAAALVADHDRWAVRGAVTVDSVAAVLEQSRDLPLPAHGVIDMAAADPVDSAAVALLLAWKRRADVESKPLAFDNLPATLSSLASLYGVESFIEA